MGQGAVSLFLEKNLCHYTAATGDSPLPTAHTVALAHGHPAD